MNLKDLSAACPGVDFTVPYKPYDTSFSIGDYVFKYLQKTFGIIKSSPTVENEVIVDFMKAGIKDHRLPYTQAQLMENLKCSAMEADDFLLAQSTFFAVSFEPQEYKTLGPLDFTPFVVDAHANLRAGGYGMVEKVFEGDNPLVRKTISDNYDLAKIMMEIKILDLATDTGNSHLLHLRCAYKQENRTCLVMYPWCEFDLSVFLKSAHKMPWWTQRSTKEKLILITDWMACLASGLSALHKKKIKHRDMKPENVLLDANLLPVICDFGLSKAFDKNSKSVKVQGTRAYLPPEQFDGKVGRKGDIFSLGLVFVELALLFFGQKSLKEEFTSGFYVDITKSLDDFLAKKFPLLNNSIMDDWNKRFQSLIRSMLDVAPENRPKASEVWEKAKEMVESLGAKPHCDDVSPVGSIPCEHEEREDDTELHLRENLAKLMVKE
jgi:serine/threonine protein kinase